MRRKYDFYETGKALTLALLENYPITKAGPILEPCAGKDAISGVLCQQGFNVITNDKYVDGHRYKLDARDPDLYDEIQPRTVITNPPFEDAYRILETSWESPSVRTVAFLLRLSFLEPTFDRGEFLKRHPPNVVLILPRFSFTDNGKTDLVTCAWMIWVKNVREQMVSVVTKRDIDRLMK